MKNNQSYVYVIYRLDGTPCYVGKGTGDRIEDHFKKSHNVHLARIVAKAGGILPYRKVAENLTHDEAFAAEIALIATIGRMTQGGPLVNMTDGGDGVRGHKRTPEQCAAMSAARKGCRNSPEAAAKISASLKGRPKTKEHGEAVSRAKKGKSTGHQSEETKKKRADKLRGLKRSSSAIAAAKAGQAAMTEEKRALRSARVSKALTGKKLSDEHRAKISAVQKGRKRSPEFIDKVRLGLLAYHAKRKSGHVGETVH